MVNFVDIAKLVVEVVSDKICVIMRGGSAVDASYDWSPLIS